MATSKNNKLEIGKGLRSLLQNIDADLKGPAGEIKPEVIERTITDQRILINDIEVNPKQPRKDFDETSLAELAASIKIHNIIQPLTVSKLANGKYRLIAGERRWRASQIVGLKDVPVYIRQANDTELLELSLLENLQRENLNAIEIAFSYSRLMEELSYTQEQVATRMGKERSTISNYIRLLKLPPNIQIAVRNGSLSMGHARALVNIEKIDILVFIFKEITSKQLSVRQTEDLVKKMEATKNVVKQSKQKSLPPSFQRIEDTIASNFNTKVKLNHNAKGYGNINFEYYSIEELNGLLEKLNINVT